MDSNNGYNNQTIDDENVADENFAENEHSFESENDEGRRKSKKRHITGYSLFLRHQMPSNDGKPLTSAKTKRVAEEWKSLPSEAKEAFNDDARSEMEKLKQTKGKLRCDYCEKLFSEPRTLKKHLEIHQKEKSFSCDSCPKWFPSVSSLRNHARIHQKIECEFAGCHVSLRSERERQQHYKNTHIHPHEEDEIPIRYACSFCNKMFDSRKNTLRHVRLVHGEKSHKCVFCGFATATKRDCDRHTNTCPKRSGAQFEDSEIYYAETEEVVDENAGNSGAHNEPRVFVEYI